MAGFAVFSFSFAMWRSLLPMTRRQKILSALTGLAAVCCALESGSRAPVVTFVAMFAMATFLAKHIQVFVRIWVGLVAIGLAVFLLLGQGIVDAFVQRWQTSNDTTIGRITGENLKANPLELIIANPMGIGLGLTTGYGLYQTVITTGSGAMTFDDGGSTALLESGLPGIVALWIMALALGVLNAQGLTSKSYEFRCATALLGLFSLYWVWSGIWYNHTATAFTWVSIGMWLSCSNFQNGRLTRKSERADEEDASQSPFRESKLISGCEGLS